MPLLLLPLPLLEGEPGELPEPDVPGLTAVGVVGTNVLVAVARQAFRTWAADDAVEALAFTVPLPAKLHAWASRLFASYHSLIAKESWVAIKNILKDRNATPESELTGVTLSRQTVCSGLTVTGNWITISSLTTEKSTRPVKKRAYDGGWVRNLGIKLTAKVILQTIAGGETRSGRQCG